MITAEKPKPGAVCHVCGVAADAYVAKWRVSLCAEHLDVALEQLEGMGEPAIGDELIAKEHAT